MSREDAEGSWFFGEKLLSPSSKYVISSRRGRHNLSVKDVKKEDQGKYSFTVGKFRTSASLKMKCESSREFLGGNLELLALSKFESDNPEFFLKKYVSVIKVKIAIEVHGDSSGLLW